MERPTRLCSERRSLAPRSSRHNTRSTILIPRFVHIISLPAADHKTSVCDLERLRPSRLAKRVRINQCLHRSGDHTYVPFYFPISCANSTDVLSCLRAADFSILQAANLAVNAAAFFGTFATAPVIDGEFVTQRPTQALRLKKVNGVSLHICLVLRLLTKCF